MAGLCSEKYSQDVWLVVSKPPHVASKSSSIG